MGTAVYLAQFNLLQSLRSFFERVTERPWTVLIELLLIATIVYIILRFLQGTRGARFGVTSPLWDWVLGTLR